MLNIIFDMFSKITIKLDHQVILEKKNYLRYVFKDFNIFRDHHKIESSDDSEGIIDLLRGIKL